MNTTVTYTRLADPNETIAYRACVRVQFTDDEVHKLAMYGIAPLADYYNMLDSIDMHSVVAVLRDEGVCFEFENILTARERSRAFMQAAGELPRYWQVAEQLLSQADPPLGL